MNEIKFISADLGDAVLMSNDPNLFTDKIQIHECGRVYKTRYTRKFMDEMYDRIIEFAELQEFQDRPFKQLSSGMKSRLAFSIASLVQPDILILDEVLSVGDGAFRQKSEAKMREIISGGATTILVSHSIRQVRSMCSKILWLHKGKQIEFGTDVQGICDRYEAFLQQQ